MKIQMKACGDYGTNCYIVEIDGKSLIIDPGQNAVDWVKKTALNPIAILNTHGHFDHVWSNAALQKEYNIPLYTPKEDAFMLESDPFGYGIPPSFPDIRVDGNEHFEIESIHVQFLHFPGHTPGCSVIVIGDVMFSGDFIFQNSIGRYDFPYSHAKDMKESLERFLLFKDNLKVYPGHGGSTTVFQEQGHIPHWLRYF